MNGRGSIFDVPSSSASAYGVLAPTSTMTELAVSRRVDVIDVCSSPVSAFGGDPGGDAQWIAPLRPLLGYGFPPGVCVWIDATASFSIARPPRSSSRETSSRTAAPMTCIRRSSRDLLMIDTDQADVPTTTISSVTGVPAPALATRSRSPVPATTLHPAPGADTRKNPPGGTVT